MDRFVICVRSCKFSNSNNVFICTSVVQATFIRGKPLIAAGDYATRFSRDVFGIRILDEIVVNSWDVRASVFQNISNQLEHRVLNIRSGIRDYDSVQPSVHDREYCLAITR